jgi:adenylate cyclase
MSARLTVKFERRQLSREEYEYEIPYEEAIELLSHASSGVIEKTRYTLPHGRFVWEVDVFSGARAGLIIAEIELTREDDQLQTPPWIGREVTGDKRYSNRSLAACKPIAMTGCVATTTGSKADHRSLGLCTFEQDGTH